MEGVTREALLAIVSMELIHIRNPMEVGVMAPWPAVSGTRTIRQIMSKTVLAFDLYGTLLSTASIANALLEHFGKTNADLIAKLWRKYQIEYTFRLNAMKRYEDFEEVTRKSLLHTLEESQQKCDVQEVEAIIQAYGGLFTFADVVPALESLKTRTDVEVVVFSNGTRKMIENSIQGCPELAPHHDTFSQLISVDHIQSFKPAPEVYRYLVHCVGKTEEKSKIWLVSSNAFDVVGARSAGLNAIWVDREGHGWQDKLGPDPSVIVRGLDGVAGCIPLES